VGFIRERPSRFCKAFSLLVAVFVTLPGIAAASENLLVFVSVVPQKTIVERVAGNGVQVEVMVRPGHSPATYEPTARQVAKLAKAKLYVLAGVAFENAWLSRIRAVNPTMMVLDPQHGIAKRTLDGHHHGDIRPGPQANLDPHVWTSPLLVKTMAGNIHDKLVELDPEHHRRYADNLAGLRRDLDALDAEIRALLQNVAERRFLVFHPAWGYFADTYELEQVTVETGGKEPGPQALASLIAEAERHGLKTIFVQPQFSAKAAAAIAQAIGARIESLDPLAADYFANMRRVARLIAESTRP
jgi:zinc transport system substrate-binding protein